MDPKKDIFPDRPIVSVADLFAKVPLEALRAWAAGYGSDFRRAWEECPEVEWLIDFAVLVSHDLGPATNERVMRAMMRAMRAPELGAMATAAELWEAMRRRPLRSPWEVRLFATPRAELLAQLRADLDGPSLLREAGLIR